MLKPLRYKNQEIPGFFISDEGKIYDGNGVEQELKLYPSEPYFYFKKYKVHKLMAHSFLGYKPGYDVHHKNECKRDNRLQNLHYISHSQHSRLHNLGIKRSEQSKAKNRAAHPKKPVYCLQLNKVFESIHAASKELSLHRHCISNCCKGKCKTTRRITF